MIVSGSRERAVTLAVLGPLYLAACAGLGPGGQEAVPDVSIRKTVSGNYLSALHAHRINDLSAAAQNFTAVLEANPGNLRLMQRTFVAKIVDGRTDEAQGLAKKLVKRQSGHTFGRLTLALLALKQNNYDDARRQLSALTDSRLTQIMRPLLLAWIEAGAENWQAADNNLDLIRKQGGFGLLAELHAGYIAALKGDFDALDTAFKAALKDTDRPPARLRIAAALHYAKLGDRDKARDILADSDLPDQNMAILSSILASVEAGQPAKGLVSSVSDGVAEALFDIASALQRDRGSEIALIYARLALYMRPDFPLARLLVGETLDDRGRHSEALKIYASIGQDSIYHMMARLRTAAAYEAESDRESALSVLQELAKSYPENGTILIRLADTLRAGEHWEKAIKIYDEAFEKLGERAIQDWRLFYSRGIARERAKKWDLAELDFLNALKLAPEQPYVMNYLGYSWVEQGRNLKKAQTLIERAVKQRPDDGYIVDSLGWVLYRTGQYGEAVTHLERAVQLRPGDVVINDHLGDAYWQIGRLREAHYQWRRSLELNPNSQLAAQLKRKLREGMPKETGTHVESNG